MYIIVGVLLLILLVYSDSIFASYRRLERVVMAEPYFDSLTRADLDRRASRDASEYRQKYLANYTTFSLWEKIKIWLTTLGDNPIYRAVRRSDWYIVKFKNDIHVELGNPHTMQNIIILTGPITSEVILHEFVHLYQRMYPAETHRLLNQLGFQKAPTYLAGPFASNPDVELATDYTYQGIRLKMVYTDDNPNYALGGKDVGIDSTGDVVEVNYGMDLAQGQPYEVMAELIVRYYLDRPMRDDFRAKIDKWLSTI